MIDLLRDCTLHILTENIIRECFPFSCGQDSSELQEDIYTKPPKDKAERCDREQYPRHLNTRLMFCDLLEPMNVK